MCDQIPTPTVGRRALVATSGALGGALLGGGLSSAAHAETGPTRRSRRPSGASRHRTRLVLLGTAAGRTVYGGTERQGISSAVAVGDATYLVDLGDGWMRRYLQAGLGEQRELRGLERLEAVFITHLHSDHLVDLPQLLAFGSTDGLSARTRPVRLFGPAGRGKLVPLTPNAASEPPVVNSENPTPGTVDTMNYFIQALSADLNDNMRDSLKPDPRTLIRAQDIVVPPGIIDDPDVDPAPRMAPIEVFEDDRVKVTATLVNHPPVFPAFAYRFDSEDGSIVFSGDTTACDNLIRLAQGADILVHEVIDRAWVESLFPSPPSPEQQAKIEHLLHSHTPIEDVGAVAEAACVKKLVLSHLAPANNPRHRWAKVRRGFSGELVVGDDLMQIGVGIPRARA